MKKQEILEIIERRKGERWRTMRTYQTGAAHANAAAAWHELLDLQIEIEKIGRKPRKRNKPTTPEA